VIEKRLSFVCIIPEISNDVSSPLQFGLLYEVRSPLSIKELTEQDKGVHSVWCSAFAVHLE